jgi:hypothetical protein
VATWLDQDSVTGGLEIVVSKYWKQSATWSEALVLPGSLGELTGAPRGVPAAAFDDANTPFIVWQRGAEMVSTRFDSKQGVWSGHVTVVGALQGSPVREPPALVFDGQTFVLAYLANRATGTSIEAVRYDRATNTWSTPETMHSAATAPAARMPRLTVDAHGNLLLVWASTVKQYEYLLAYQRFDAAAKTWRGAKPIAGATLNHGYFNPEDGAFSLGGNASGLAALTFFDYPRMAGGGATCSNLRLASFY